MHFRNVAQASGVRFVHHYSRDAGPVLRRERARVASRSSTTTATAVPTSSSRTAPIRRRSKRAPPRYANRLYRNDGQFRFTDVTDGGRRAGDRLRDGRGGRGLRQRRPRRSLRGRRPRSNQLCATAATADSKTSPPARASPAATGPSRPAGSTTTTTAGWICWSSTTCSGRRTPTGRAAIQVAAIAIYCHPRAFQGLPRPPVPQPRRRHVRRRLGARRPSRRTSARA